MIDNYDESIQEDDTRAYKPPTQRSSSIESGIRTISPGLNAGKPKYGHELQRNASPNVQLPQLDEAAPDVSTWMRLTTLVTPRSSTTVSVTSVRGGALLLAPGRS